MEIATATLSLHHKQCYSHATLLLINQPLDWLLTSDVIHLAICSSRVQPAVIRQGIGSSAVQTAPVGYGVRVTPGVCGPWVAL